jgi:drug/metabolite transporter (DMT)-like permease
VTPANRRGILTMIAAMAFFVVNDALVKLASDQVPTAQLIFLRGLVTTSLLLAATLLMGQWHPMQALRSRAVWARAALDTVATFAYLTALFHLPLGVATAIVLASPLFLALMARTLLNEQIERLRWWLIGIGFAGVLLVVQPATEGFNAFALLCLGATVLQAGRDLSTRLVPPQVPSLLITLFTVATVTLASAGWTWSTGIWVAPDGRHWTLLIVAGACLGCAHQLLTLSMRAGDMSVVGLFRYSGLLFALLLGFVVWGELPNPLAWIGIGLIVMAGVTMLHRERARVRATLDAALD